MSNTTSKLTKRQQEVLDFVEKYINEHFSPPTRVEIANGMGFRSPNAAEDHLKALAKKGAIELIPGTSRGIRLPGHSGLPIISTTTLLPDKPILSPEHIENNYKIDKTLFHPNANFLVRITDNTLKSYGISESDLLVVHLTQTAHNNQIIVARLNDSIKIKHFHQERDTVTLTPPEPGSSSSVLDLKKDSFKIEGIAVGLIKTKL